MDLHTHSNYSDGRLPPADLVEEALFRGLSAIALTDHDTLDGNEEAVLAGRERGLEVIPGIEMSCEMDGQEVHLLGYFMDADARLRKRLEEMRLARETRMQAMLDRLEEMGIVFTMKDIPQEAGKSFGRPHLAQAMVSRGIVRSVSEAFARYLGDSGPVYVAKERFTVADAIEHIHDAGGLAVVAHPGVAGVFPHLPELERAGIDGVEAYYPKHSPTTASEIAQFCQRHDLVVTGGSDFHALGEGPSLGVPPVEMSILDSLKARRNSAPPRP